MKSLFLFSLILLALNSLLFSQTDSLKTTVIIENLGPKVNSEYDELNPIISPDGKMLYFVRQNHPKNTFGVEGSQDIWVSTLGKDSAWMEAVKMGKPFNIEQYNGIINVTPDGNTVLIRGAYKEGVYKGLGYSFAHKGKKKWKNPEMLNIKKLKSMDLGANNSAFLSNDGQTLLLSFSEEHFGEQNDLYVSFMQKDKSWSKPKNIGTVVNTEKNEAAPFLAADGVTLYFGSDREGGRGGLDIYMTRRLDDTWEKWSEPVNLGEGINTSANEAYYSLDAAGKFAYMVLYKEAVGESDIVKIKLKEEIQPDPVVMVYGNVYNKKTNEPLEADLTYEVLSDTSGIGGVARTNPDDGGYKIILPRGKVYGFTATAQGFMSASENVDATQITEYTEIKKDLYLVPFEVGQTVRLQNIFFDHNKATLRPESFPELDRVKVLLTENPKMTIEVAGHTDNVGSDDYNLRLSDERANAVRDYLLQTGIESNRINAKGYGETKHIAENETEEGKQLNRRVEFTILTK
ncbi:MAG TPA: flagellar motor protein MotB [Bacteroidales bacterium]|nr:MAG: hypothetical protein A2W98_02075 [Bacteroidetes bacterium GWF2_33_38]OFY74250.1 MAG: hypothetical protein A2265_01680 [Bacteroidetes bacterium RIFOXYA12_FULL_33_9]HBF88455.1 flagellar motor protein MotB [Bacteroidales bacterium]